MARFGRKVRVAFASAVGPLFGPQMMRLSLTERRETSFARAGEEEHASAAFR